MSGHEFVVLERQSATFMTMVMPSMDLAFQDQNDHFPISKVWLGETSSTWGHVALQTLT